MELKVGRKSTGYSWRGKTERERMRKICKQWKKNR